MVWMRMQAGRDYLEPYTRMRPIDAMTELVWNGLDAEATEVDVEVETASMGQADDELRYVTRIVVKDNGHGITHERATASFVSLGDSWKKTLNGKTLNGQRALHGSQGKGRLYAYSLGYRVQWLTVAEVDGERVQFEITGELGKMEGFDVGDPQPTRAPTGTHVSVLVGQDRVLAPLVRDDLHLQLATHLAGHLLGNRDIAVRVNGVLINPELLIEGEPAHMDLADIPADQLGDREVPVLTIVDWTDEMRSAPGLVLCNEHWMSLVEMDKPKPNAAVKSTGYVRWSGFNQSRVDLALARMRYPDIIDQASKTYERHVKARLGTVTAAIVTRLQDEGAYPYEVDKVTDPIRRTEREMYDLIVVAVRSALNSGSRQQRAMSARLLKLALEERSEDLDKILAETLDLSLDLRDQLAEMLRYSTLGQIVGAAAEVTRRLNLISALRHYIYSSQSAKRFREVDQLHPLIKDNVWIFGEEWRLSRSEASLTSVLRDAVHDEAMLEVDLIERGDVGAVEAEGGNRRVDLVLQRTVRSPGRLERLVIELKRPSVVLGDKELGQVRGYANALSKHPGVGQTKWTFWLIGSAWNENELEDQIHQTDRAVGHIVATARHDIWVTTWGKLLDDAERRLDFYREQLKYDITQEAAVEKVRSRHSELLSPQTTAKAV